ncbi:hypothetical protein ACOSQ3_014619 [Xanthoceras sorbifolium]
MGSSDPLVAEAWLKHIEKVFTAIACPHEQKDATSHILRTTLQENDSITWEMFMNALNNKYFPDRVRFRIERDFLNLKQGSKTVAEYEEQFTSLVEVLKLGRYADIIDQALIASRFMKEFKKAREAYRNINFRGGSSNGNASKQGSQFRKCGGHDGSEKVFGDVSFMKNAPPCQHCGCSHAGEFFRKTRACFSYGKIDHMIKDFPKRHFSPDNASTDDKKKKLCFIYTEMKSFDFRDYKTLVML